jgi:hypothetical protein
MRGGAGPASLWTNKEVSELTPRRFWNGRQHSLLLCSRRDQSQQLCLSRSAEHEIGLNRSPSLGPHNRCNQNNRYVTTNCRNPQNLYQTINRYKRHNRNFRVNVLHETGYTRLSCSDTVGHIGFDVQSAYDGANECVKNT